MHNQTLYMSKTLGVQYFWIELFTEKGEITKRTKFATKGLLLVYQIVSFSIFLVLNFAIMYTKGGFKTIIPLEIPTVCTSIGHFGILMKVVIKSLN